MTTKKQEREALARIREILETLDSDGYVNTAFEGVLDIAETNIENDWACSLKEQVESARAGESDWKEKYSRALEEIRSANARISELESDWNETLKERDALEDQLKQEKEAWGELNKTAIALENRAAMLGNNNIRLKAKLYDYIVKEG